MEGTRRREQYRPAVTTWTRLRVPMRCMFCGRIILTVEELDTHDLRCPKRDVSK